MSIIGNNILAGASGQGGAYEIERSLRFNRPDTAYLGFTPSSAGNQKTWTWSAWLKRSRVSVSGDYYYLFTPNGDSVIRFNDNDTLEFYDTGGTKGHLTTNQLFRDVSAWYHIVYVLDTTVSSPSSDRLKLYVNGERVTSFSTESYPSQDDTLGWNAAVAHSLGRWELYAAQYFDGYMAEVNFIDGTAEDVSAFGKTDTATGAWIPKKYSGSYGTNGFYLSFSDNSSVSALGTDSSGNGNNWTPNNFSVTAGAGNDSLEDSPTNNWCTWNPLDAGASGSTFSNGNLNLTTASSGFRYMGSTIWASSGKIYAEIKITSSSGYDQVGIETKTTSTDKILGADADSWAYDGWDGRYINNSTQTTFGSTFTTNDVIGIALDRDNHKLYFSKNGTWQNSADPAAGTGSIDISSISGVAAMIAVCDNNNTGSSGFEANFGQRAFAYTPPTGFKALNTANLPVPTIKNGTDYFNTVLYTGTGATNPITTVGFQPDLVWIKKRNSAANHGLHDSVRVIGGLEAVLYSNTTDAESTGGAYLSSFDTSGFTLNANTSGNALNDTFVAWNWKAGGSGSSNTDGSITSTVSANPSTGFSIVTYTGNGTDPGSNTVTVGHGLGAEPAFIITKKRSSGTTDYGWSCWHKDLGAGYGIWLHLSSARNAAMWQGDINHSSTVFSPATLNYNNESGQTYVNYVFAEVEGYSKFGSYTGNGSADGPFVSCGFRPSLILLKSSTAAESWEIMDNKRDVYNGNTGELRPNLSSAETTSNQIDFLSNGFKIRTLAGQWNTSNETYIFMALAENPFKYANAR